MGRTNVYADRRLVCVKLSVPKGTSGVSNVGKYGFRTNIDRAEGAILGHEPARTGAGAYVAGLIFGANAPKPHRLKRSERTYSVTSYCAFDRVGSALGAGWKQVKGITYRSPTSTAKSRQVYVEVRGIKYAWNMPKRLYDRLQSYRASFGFVDAQATDLDLVYAPSFPKPPVVGFITDGEGEAGQDFLSSFANPSNLNSLPEGFQIVDPGNYGGI